MIDPIRVLLAGSAFALGASTIAVGLVPSSAAFAQAAQKPAEAPQQAELTQKQIDGFLAAQPELAKVEVGDSDKPDPKIKAKIDDIAKKAGFADAEELQDTGDSVEAVLGGMDPQTKSYVGVTALIKKQLSAVQADKKMPAKDKAAAVKELKEALAAGEPAKPSAGNIALVTKNFDKLSQLQGGDQ